MTTCKSMIKSFIPDLVSRSIDKREYLTSRPIFSCQLYITIEYNTKRRGTHLSEPVRRDY